ncbi:MAG: CHAT domain-containing protein [Acidobacteria bacterium]|nr:CHAT domain-containing protein [Acidobacteriota bacterium]
MSIHSYRHFPKSRLLCICLLCPLLALGILTTTKAEKRIQQDATPLSPDFVIERELKGGETNTYQVSLVAGQFLYAVIDQRGIDVAVTVIGPDGSQILKVESPNGRVGPEPVVMVSDAGGDFRINVSSTTKQALAGRYELKVIALRKATQNDRDHVAAQRAFEEAHLKLRPQRTAPSRRAAIEKYQAALHFFEAAGDRYWQALTLFSIGATLMESGEFRKALEFLNPSLLIFQALGNKSREAAALNFIGGAYDVLGDLYKALDYYDQALKSVRSGGERGTEASILNNIGKIHSDLADWQKSLEFYSQALPIFRDIGDKRREAISIHNIGIAHIGLGEMEKALEYFRQELPLRKSIKDKSGEADALSGVGSAYAGIDDVKNALESYNQALTLQREVGDGNGEGDTLSYIGAVYLQSGAQQKALDSLQMALSLTRKAGNRRREGIISGDLGRAYSALGQTDKAIEHLSQSIAIFRSIGDRNGEARALLGMARAQRDTGKQAAALKSVEDSLSLIEEVRARVTSKQLRASYLATRQDAYQFHIDLLMRMHSRDSSAGFDAAGLQASERARARSMLEMLTESRLDIREGVDAALLKREQEVKQQINVKASRLYQSSPEQAENLKKDLSLLESQYQLIEAAIRKDNPHYSAITNPEPLSLKEIQQQILDDRTLLLEYALGDESSYLWAVTSTSIASYELPGRNQIDKAARQVTELLNARSVINRNETAKQRSERITKADTELPEAVKQLSRMVIEPAAAQLGTRRLMIVADGALQYVPFAMLTRSAGKSAATPLVAEHEIISLPSASTLAVMRKELAGRKPAPKWLAVIADPVFTRGDERFKLKTLSINDKAPAPAEASAGSRSVVHLAESGATVTFGKFTIQRLPYTRQEADRILAISPARANLRALDFNASRATVMSNALKEYRYLHFATHGLLDSENPGLSAMVLSLLDEQGNPQDGFLRADEIYNLKLPAELVVLSACQTGLGKEIKGEGLVGLTRGFMYAGAARVVVSLWSVNDKATAELMARFYQKMLKDGQPPAAALRSAQIEMWKQKQWQSPYYWAAFVLQGEWR